MIEKMVAKDGIEPPPPAFSGLQFAIGPDMSVSPPEKLRSTRRSYENALREGCSAPMAGREGSPHKIVAAGEGPRVQ